MKNKNLILYKFNGMLGLFLFWCLEIMAIYFSTHDVFRIINDIIPNLDVDRVLNVFSLFIIMEITLWFVAKITNNATKVLKAVI